MREEDRGRNEGEETTGERGNGEERENLRVEGGERRQ